MRYRLLFIIGLLAGYVLGARAGRDRFDEIKEAATDALDDPRVKKVVDAVTPDALKSDGSDSAAGTGAAADAPAAPTPSPAPKPAPTAPAAAPAAPALAEGELPTVSTEEPLTTPVEDALDPATVEALEALAEADALREDEARTHRDD